MRTIACTFTRIIRNGILTSYCLAVFFLMTGCSGSDEAQLPTITLIDNIGTKDGLPVYSESLKLKTDAKQGFIEILSNDAYEKEQNKGFFDARTWSRDTYLISEGSIISIPMNKYLSNGDQKLWVRAASPAREHIIKGSNLDRIFYSLVGVPIDETKHKKVIRIELESRGKVYYFYNLGIPKPFLIQYKFAEGSQEERPQSYSNSKWGFSFTYPLSWDLYSNRSFTEKTHGLWNVPDAIVIVANMNDSEENFIVKANPAPSGTIPKSVLQDMIGSLDQQYRERYQGFRKLHAKIVEMAGARGIEYLMDNEREGTKLRQKILFLIKNGKSFIWTFTAHRDRYDQVNKEFFEGVLGSLRIK